MIVHTYAQVHKRLKNFADQYKFQADAAADLGCTPAQLSQMLTRKLAPTSSVLEKLGLERMRVYASKIESKYREGP